MSTGTEAKLRELHVGLFPALRAALGCDAYRTAPAPVIAAMGIVWLVVRMDSAEACLAELTEIHQAVYHALGTGPAGPLSLAGRGRSSLRGAQRRGVGHVRDPGAGAVCQPVVP